LKYDNKPIFPLEIKPIGYDANKILEYFTKIEARLLTLNLGHPILNKATSYLLDAYLRLEENDIEGARTSIRKSLDILRADLVTKIEVVAEAKDFPQNLKKLINGLREFVQYGGPHPGPAPRTTTEMILSMSIELIKYLAKAIESKVISLKENE